jgi:hypothetical protein
LELYWFKKFLWRINRTTNYSKRALRIFNNYDQVTNFKDLFWNFMGIKKISRRKTTALIEFFLKFVKKKFWKKNITTLIDLDIGIGIIIEIMDSAVVDGGILGDTAEKSKVMVPPIVSSRKSTDIIDRRLVTAKKWRRRRWLSGRRLGGVIKKMEKTKHSNAFSFSCFLIFNYLIVIIKL